MINRLEIIQTLKDASQPVDWDAVYGAELPRIYNYFLYKVCNREIAQDLTATTFERAWRNRSKYRFLIASPSTWLFGIARNIFKEHLRSIASEDNIDSLQHFEQLPSIVNVEQSFQVHQEIVRLQSLLLELPEREQELIALKYGAQLTNREIAKIVRLSESNVGSVLHRTITSLRMKWDDSHG